MRKLGSYLRNGNGPVSRSRFWGKVLRVSYLYEALVAVLITSGLELHSCQASSKYAVLLLSAGYVMIVCMAWHDCVHAEGGGWKSMYATIMRSGSAYH